MAEFLEEHSSVPRCVRAHRIDPRARRRIEDECDSKPSRRYADLLQEPAVG
jgi:hypothetical protein